MSLQAVIEAARADLGYAESPANSNMTKFGEWYGMNGQPWCVMALAFWFDKAGERMAFFGGRKTARCSILLEWYQKQELTVDVADIRVGDIPILNFHGSKDTEHCGLAVEVERDKNGKLISVMTIEGNTTPGEEGTPKEQANGGCVALKRRFPRQIVAVCRPQYQPEEETAVPDYKGRWSEEYWEKGIALGIVKKAKDGKYRPTDAATREEVLAMIVRAKEG